MSHAEQVPSAVHDQLVDTVAEIKPRLRGWLHAATAPLAFFTFLAMLVLAETTRERFGVAVYMVSALLLFTSSAVYHTGRWSPERKRLLKRVDHANIFVLIAGSSTPFALMLLSQERAAILLGTMWGGALLGILFKIFWVDAPRWANAPLYLLLGWAPVLFAGDFIAAASPAVLSLLAAGGLLYTAGAVVYGTKRPDPAPTFFGYHEVFHSLTIAAFAAHCIGVGVLLRTQG
ncbi:PAQR family membrane homeostasis protein TrhA [Aeromicrobium chenweiae]|uniref:DNA-binding protein n=1 Tax=Aeromicrobium chenweiae TaxID=2079793 RepID=A0A2S0WQ72_9ACTN|nr:hemolysin III family protein [Aeromicrobium chenweiae]AWB93477.1 DNA-binding protein [Aeromicrobium chenweiae]TGN34470.1 hemolysin III family protein [Aeromicrobium chenweiae]